SSRFSRKLDRADAQRISASRTRPARRGLGRAPAPAWRGDRRLRLRRHLLVRVTGIVPGRSRVAHRCGGCASPDPGRALAGAFVHAPAATAGPHAPAAGWNLPARASPRLRGRDPDRTWLVACRGPARPRADRAPRPALRPEGAARGGLA